MRIPFTTPLLPDELLYSFVQRLSIANGIPFALFDMAYALRPEAEIGIPVHRPRRDSANDYSLLYHSLNREETVRRFFMNTTIFPGYVPLMSKTMISGYVARWSFRPELNNWIPAQNPLLSRLRICPECAREEVESLGSYYLHRSHQMVDAAICYKHGCRLLQYYRRDRFTEISDRTMFRPMDYHERATEYEQFLHELLYAEIQLPLKDVLWTLQQTDRNEAKQYHKLKTNQIPPCKAAHSIYKVFGSVDALMSELPGRNMEREELVCKAILGHCRLTQSYREDFFELQCLGCGLVFLSTPYRVLQGFRCPDCDRKLSREELMHRVVSCSYQGEYSLEESCKTTQYSVSLIHSACGNVCRTTLQSFLTGELQCECCKRPSEDDLKTKVREAGNCEFELVKLKGENQLIIRHKLCGYQFTRRSEMFFRYPVCPECSLKRYRPRVRMDYLWDTMTKRNKRKKTGGTTCLEYQKNEKLQKVEAPVLSRIISPGSRSVN